ncbi:hypothetical protein PITCH_A190039 [uncultured Desulfobacterium sp.]|uniref:Uncharacterized protein n=1 Tax=uncultured Desulfobacterium sp. TaxID=201089 RepID=A0A445MVJ6_9BACT|nr:hypothetical protein PITCH_A190039 [uncultured Desulfobacterium sp.]
MKPINKRVREWFLGCALIVAAVLVWWIHVYSPLLDRGDELKAEIDKDSQQRDRMTQRLEKLSATKDSPAKIEEKVGRLMTRLIKGETLDEVSIHTQLWLQEFMQTHALALAAYKGLSPSKWRNYPLSLVEFQLSATTQGLSDLLEGLENMGQAVRIERLEVNYSRNREYDLSITLQLGVLFVEGIKR